MKKPFHNQPAAAKSGDCCFLFSKFSCLKSSSPARRLAAILIAAGIGQAALADSTNTAGPASRYEGPGLLTGTIYATGSNPRKALFKFKREAVRSGTRVNVLREFTDLEGKPAARERFVYEGDDLVSYALEELQIGAGGSARIQREPGNPAQGTIAFEYSKDLRSGTKVKTSSESLRGDTLVGDMIGEFLRAHWLELFRGDKVKCRYIVVPRRETVGFTFVKDSERTMRERSALIVRMEATSPIIAALVDPLYFTVETENPHRVTQYIGRVTPKIQKGEKWEDLDGRFVFDWQR